MLMIVITHNPQVGRPRRPASSLAMRPGRPPRHPLPKGRARLADCGPRTPPYVSYGDLTMISPTIIC